MNATPPTSRTRFKKYSAAPCPACDIKQYQWFIFVIIQLEMLLLFSGVVAFKKNRLKSGQGRALNAT
jgi:hypothetical protein